MQYIKERPRCRKEIEKLLLEYSISTLKNIANGFLIGINDHKIFVSDGIKTQARKMYYEINKKPPIIEQNINPLRRRVIPGKKYKNIYE